MHEEDGLTKAQSRIERLNASTPDEAAAELLKCCGSSLWAQRMSAELPFQDERDLLRHADRLWWKLERADWLEAFRSHPKIGEQRAAEVVSEEARRWSQQEQQAASGATPQTLQALAAANVAYEAKFGYIFIVCATGRSAAEMLALLERRLTNDPETEICVAAEEQRRITRLRLQKLLDR